MLTHNAGTGTLGDAFSALAGLLGLRASPAEVHVVFAKVVDARGTHMLELKMGLQVYFYGTESKFGFEFTTISLQDRVGGSQQTLRLLLNYGMRGCLEQHCPPGDSSGHCTVIVSCCRHDKPQQAAYGKVCILS